MTIASTPTLLSLSRFARIVGLSPIHFSGAVAGDHWPITTMCDDIWFQFAWQTPAQLVCREEIAYEIAKAELDIKNMMGYSPAPTWEWREPHSWPNRYSRSPKQFALQWGKIIAPGVRTVAEIEMGATVVYSDANLDGWSELATVTVSTTLEDPREIKLYFADHEGEPEWEIRPLLKVVIDPDADTATITAESWLFIDPDLWHEYPDNEGPQPIDISTTANYVVEVDVYREYNDTQAFGATFLLNTGVGGFHAWPCNWCGYGTCASCGATTQAGTFQIVEGIMPVVMPYPASYDAALGWRADSFAACSGASLVAFNYYAGEQDKNYLRGKRLDPLSDAWADIIAWMAVARLPRGVCGCDNIRQRIDEMQRDLTRNTQEVAYSRSDRMDVFNSAFGTRAGEVRAWQAVTRVLGDQIIMGSVL